MAYDDGCVPFCYFGMIVCGLGADGLFAGLYHKLDIAAMCVGGVAYAASDLLELGGWER